MKITIKVCLRCGHDWASKQEQPMVCPACKSPYWNTPKKDKKPVEAGK